MPLQKLLETVSYRVIAVAALGAAALPAAAQDTTPRQLPGLSVETERPAGTAEGEYKVDRVASPKYTEPLLNTPQTITVVPSTVIEERGQTSLREVLRGIPGISLVAGEGGGAQGDVFRIRGFAANTDLFVDQIRDPSQYNRDPFFIEQVEVIKGPASTYIGRGSTGGSVNLVTKTPQRTAFYDGIGTLGTDLTRRITLDVNQPLGELTAVPSLQTSAFRIAAMGHEADVAERNVVENSRFGFAPSFAAGLGTDTRFTLTALYMEEHNIPDYGLPLRAGQNPFKDFISRENFYGFRDLNTEDVTVEMTTIKLEHDLNDTFTLRNQMRREYTTRFSIVSPPRNPSTVTNTVSRNPTGRDGDNEFWVNQSDVVANFSTGSVGHSVVSGLELSHEHSENQPINFTGSPLDSLTNPNPDTPFTGRGTRNLKTDTSANTWALYVFDTIKLNEQWQLVGGVRFDNFATDFKTGQTELSRVDEMWSGRGAVLYKPAPNGTIYAGYGTSFNPSAESLTLSANVTSAAYAGIGPEQNETYEVGTKWDLMGDQLAVNFAIFQTKKTNARTQDPNDPTDITVLDGEEKVEGFEVGVVGKVTKAIQIMAGYAYMNSIVTKTKEPNELGNAVGNTPKHTASVWATWESPWRTQFGFGAQYVHHRTVSTSNPEFIDGYYLFDAMASYHLTDNVDLRVNLNNITNEFYFERVHGGGQHGVPGAGRTALFSVALRY